MKPSGLRISTSGLDSVCSKEASVADFSISLTFPMNDRCSFSASKSLGITQEEMFTEFSGSDLSGCVAGTFSEGLTGIELKKNGQGPWCLKNMEVDLNNGKTFGCLNIDQTKLAVNTKACKPVELKGIHIKLI